MPDSFVEVCVHKNDAEQIYEMRDDIDNGALFATADFRVKATEGWVRVCLFRSNSSENTASGIVRNVSERYAAIIEETERRKTEPNLHVEKELEALQLMRAVSDSSDMIISVNLTKNSYYVISNKQLQDNERYNDGTFDDLFLQNLRFIPDEYKDEYVYCDKLRINRIIANLLSNAVKFTPTCETILIEAGFEVDTVEDGIYAVDIIKTPHPIITTTQYSWMFRCLLWAAMRQQGLSVHWIASVEM